MITEHRTFCLAVCEHFELDGSKIIGDMKLDTNDFGSMTITLKFMVTPEDLIGIATKMQELQDR